MGTNLEGQPQAVVPSGDWKQAYIAPGYPGPLELDPEILLGTHPELACLNLNLFSQVDPPYSPGDAYLNGTVNNMPSAFWSSKCCPAVWLRRIITRRLTSALCLLANAFSYDLGAHALHTILDLQTFFGTMVVHDPSLPMWRIMHMHKVLVYPWTNASGENTHMGLIPGGYFSDSGFGSNGPTPCMREPHNQDLSSNDSNNKSDNLMPCLGGPMSRTPPPTTLTTRQVRMRPTRSIAGGGSPGKQFDINNLPPLSQ